MRIKLARVLVGMAAAGTAATFVPGAIAQESQTPRVTTAKCRAAEDCDPSGAVKRGRYLRLRGSGFARGATVIFRGAAGSADDTRARAIYRSRRTIDVKVPAAAKSGRVAARNGSRGRFGAGVPVRVSLPAPRPYIASAACRASTDCNRSGAVKPGSALRLRGRNFTKGARIVFYGAPGAADNTTAVGRLQSSRTFDVRVPAAAKSGTIAMRPINGPRSSGNPRVQVGQPTSTPAETGEYMFPVRGPHNYGGEQSKFGADRGGRAHRGHDVFAAAGTPLVAARGGTVYWKAYQGSGAGHYIVIHGDDGKDYVYMHMQAASIVNRGDAVRTGQPIGKVGCSGSCSGAHLHFEMWTAHWYDGGAPFDPLPYLKRWDEQDN